MLIHGPSLGIGSGITIATILIILIIFNGNLEINSNVLIEEKFEAKQTTDVFFDNASPVMGQENASITLVEFGDYQCYFCNQHFHNTEHELVEKYVKTGKVRMLFKDFIIIGPDSKAAALSAHCAGEQGKFWDFHDILFNNWAGENNGWASPENLWKFSKELDLDMKQMTECMNENRYIEKINSSSYDAESLGLTGTPAFFIIDKNNNVVKISGAQPFDVFQKIFDQINNE